MDMTLRQSFYSYSADQLERFAKLLKLPVTTPSSTEPLVERICKYATNPKNLAKLYLQLDEIDKHYVAEVLHSTEWYDLDAFEVRYGSRPSVYGFGNRFICLARIFVDRNAVHSDLRDYLLEFVPPPQRTVLKTLTELPKFVACSAPTPRADADGRQTLPPGKELAQPTGNDPELNPLAIRFTEHDALNDVVNLLHLVNNGKITVSDKKAVPNSAAIKEIADVLKRGDFYAQSSKESSKPVAWATFLQTSDMCQAKDGRLSLCDNTPAFLLTPACDTIFKIWYSWLAQSTVDEFRRLDAIKVEKSVERKFGFRDYSQRRNNIVRALSLCPPLEWIEVDEFFRFMRQGGLHFHVTAADHAIQVMNHDAGRGNDRLHSYWDILQGRYILLFLFEYAATLGLVDVAFTSASRARSDFQRLPGTENLSALSRYDGLRFFRVNALGRYCLGLSTDYKTPDAATQNKVTAMSNLTLSFNNEPTAPAAILLNMFCDQETETTWRLSKVKSIEASQQGFQLNLLRDFIEKHDDQPLPETLEAFILSVEKNSTALRTEGSAVLIECTSEDIARIISEHDSTRHLCRRAGEKHLVVLNVHEQAFRKCANTLGYGLQSASHSNLG